MTEEQLLELRNDLSARRDAMLAAGTDKGLVRVLDETIKAVETERRIWQRKQQVAKLEAEKRKQEKLDRDEEVTRLRNEGTALREKVAKLNGDAALFRADILSRDDEIAQHEAAAEALLSKLSEETGKLKLAEEYAQELERKLAAAESIVTNGREENRRLVEAASATGERIVKAEQERDQALADKAAAVAELEAARKAAETEPE